MIVIKRLLHGSIRKLVETLQDLVLSTAATVLLFRLGNMQLDGLLTFGGIALGLLFGYTSLIFNRARALSSGPIQRRSLLAGELALRATLIYTLGMVLTALIYFYMYSLGYLATPIEKMPTQLAPTILALIPLMFCIITIATLSKATRILLHRMRNRIVTRKFLRSL